MCLDIRSLLDSGWVVEGGLSVLMCRSDTAHHHPSAYRISPTLEIYIGNDLFALPGRLATTVSATDTLNGEAGTAGKTIAIGQLLRCLK